MPGELSISWENISTFILDCLTNQVELGPLTVPLPLDFCSLTYDGCKGAEPACSAMKAGEDVRLCSTLSVPTESPDVRLPGLAG